MDEKILTAHPLGKQGVKISKAKYDQTCDAILAVLRERGHLTFMQLVEAVDMKLDGRFDGSIPWYITTVKLDLEAREIIQRISETKPTQYKLATA
jgi:hypothetical protein